VEPGEVLAVPAEKVRQVVTEDPALGDLILRAFILRRSLLIELGVGVQTVGSGHSPDSRRLRDFLALIRIPHSWLDVEDDERAAELLQAGTASRIENYLGFPSRISGGELAARAVIQAERFGTRIVVPADAAALGEEDAYVVEFAEGARIVAHTMVIATGARYRRLDVPRLEEFEGVSVHYAATEIEALQCDLHPVGVVGGGNSAAQAALFLTRHSPRVHLLIRGDDLGKDMSRYLVDRIERNPSIEVHVHTEVRELVGDDGSSTPSSSRTTAPACGRRSRLHCSSSSSARSRARPGSPACSRSTGTASFRPVAARNRRGRTGRGRRCRSRRTGRASSPPATCARGP